MPVVTTFTHALVREPAPSVVNGLRAVDRGAPTLEGIRAEQDAYVAALEAAGVTVARLPALEQYPDAIFLEDPALVFGEGAILLRPGAPSRMGEAAALGPDLTARFPRLLTLEEGTVEGGDVLVTPARVLVGLSGRTSRSGAAALVTALGRLGRQGAVVATPPGVLHFKSDCSLLDEGTVLSTPRLAASGAFEGLDVVLTPEGECVGANALRVNDYVLVGRAFPRLADLLTARGYKVVALPTDEIGKLDAGLSCLSLRWHV